jgi:hypothetical protein
MVSSRHRENRAGVDRSLDEGKRYRAVLVMVCRGRNDTDLTVIESDEISGFGEHRI